jgi:hypothetical protein
VPENMMDSECEVVPGMAWENVDDLGV